MDKTFLSLKDLSEKLGVSEKTVYRMLNDKAIPFAIKIGGQWRFNSEKIEKWISTSQTNGTQRTHTNHRIKIEDALTSGLIIYRAHGSNRDEILDEILGMLTDLPADQALAVKKQILYRESIISSSLKGVSFMTPEIDGSFLVEETKLLLAFLDQPMDLKAVDQIDTHLVILLLPANKTERLILQTRLQRLLMEESFVAMLKQQPNRRQLIEQLSAMEQKLLK